MSSQTFFLLRHGLATHSLDGYWDEIFTAQVLPEGIPPIKRMGNFLKDRQTDYQGVSKFLRCQQTANILTEITNNKFVVDERLNEFYEETFTQFKKRLELFLHDLVIHKKKNVLICTHGAVIAGLKNLILQKTFTEENLLDFPKTGVLTVIEKNFVREMDFNE